jgi:hypothetical protein
MRVTSDWSDINKEVERVRDRVPSIDDLFILEDLLNQGFEDTQLVVHVDTGSLKASGKVETSFDQATGSWSGEITYGGASPGSVYDPVEYAWYEQRRDGSHDFMRNIHLFNELIHDAVYHSLGD